MEMVETTNSPLDIYGPDKSDLYGLLVKSCTNYIIGSVTLLLATDGSFDIGISHVMCWSIWIWAAVLILQSSEDACLAGGALYLLSQC
ncbi:unnamed protein product [Brassica napus]|uniref:(rape) hypothetical protein n=1 Tax=Brassica napus TaxID=3708 RepID=A0A816T9F2_BRANA|nr:unnamed protein product [Brassica napus]